MGKVDETGMKKPTNLLVHGSRLCSAIGIVWLAGLLCHFFGAKTVALWLFFAGVGLSAALLVLLVVQLWRDHRPGRKTVSKEP